MRGPTRSGGHDRVAITVSIVIAVLATVACAPPPEETPPFRVSPYGAGFEPHSPGERAAILGADGEPVLKLRLSTLGMRLYDGGFIRIGQAVDAGDGLVEVRRRDGSVLATIRPAEAADAWRTVELAESTLHLEPRDDALAIVRRSQADETQRLALIQCGTEAAETAICSVLGAPGTDAYARVQRDDDGSYRVSFDDGETVTLEGLDEWTPRAVALATTRSLTASDEDDALLGFALGWHAARAASSEDTPDGSGTSPEPTPTASDAVREEGAAPGASGTAP